jgi:hypothetical protein
MLLIDRSNAGGFRQQDFAALRDEIAEDQLEQRRFPDPVASDQAHLCPSRYRHARSIEKSPTPSIKDKILDPKHIAGANVTVGWKEKGAYRAPLEIARGDVGRQM